MSFVFKVVRTSLAFAKIFTIILKLKAQNWYEAVRKIMVIKNIFTIIVTSKVQIWDEVLKHRGFCSIPKDFYNSLMFESTNMIRAFEEARKNVVFTTMFMIILCMSIQKELSVATMTICVLKSFCFCFFMMKTKIVLTFLMQQWGCSNSLFW